VKRESLRGTGRDQTGATSVTMQIWYELDQAGQDGLKFEEVFEKVRARVPAGYAWRRYVRQQQSQHAYKVSQNGEYGESHPYSPDDTPSARAQAVRFVVRSSLSSMVQSGSALKRPDGHFAALRKPKSAFSDDQHDFDGSITRKEVALMEWLRLARPLISHIETEWKPNHTKALPTLSVAFYAVTKRLVEAHTKS